MLVNLDELLSLAERKEFAVPAFNTYNMETVTGVIQAAEEARSPVIIQVYSRLFEQGSAYYLSPVILAAAQQATVPVCFHLDHGSGELAVSRAIRYGCTGVMIDASTLPLEENAAKTRAVVELCGYSGIPVEGEVGHIGSVHDAVMEESTTVGDAVYYAEATGVTALAVMVGTAHGYYKKTPKLDIERIRDIHQAVGAHLVLHGGSGIPDDQIQAAIGAGIRKINYGTDICYAFLDQVFATSREVYALDLFMKGVVDNIKTFAMGKIRLLGAEGRA
ncbi:MAG: fructose-bisphosphate aldolase [Paenibacillaceae bacterium]|jgi:ketose-bisphosphate aldolase|nr:fructose-bisphosphate aldolase [Paenibacillaceae bacterium]